MSNEPENRRKPSRPQQKRVNDDSDFLVLPDSIARSYGKSLRFYRIRARMTQEQLATALSSKLGKEVRQAYISHIENGKYAPKSGGRLEALCSVLHCTPAEVFKRAERLEEERRCSSDDVIGEHLKTLQDDKFEISYESILKIANCIGNTNGSDVVASTGEAQYQEVRPVVHELAGCTESTSDIKLCVATMRKESKQQPIFTAKEVNLLTDVIVNLAEERDTLLNRLANKSD